MQLMKWMIFSVIALAGCSTAAMRREDTICAELATFAQATAVGETHQVVLRGGWGGDSPGALMTHDCEHSGYKPGATLCDYLISNTSWEFGSRNAERAAACLVSTEPGQFEAAWAAGNPFGVSGRLKSVPNGPVVVALKLESKSPMSGLSVLTVSATKPSN
ncbi:MAG: hypothetical protein EON58_08810 [Alphaproteobacteria bacterium]|nr:MAG: hypothetical protein EON58_08810 [Alphaproteobacteria bacterium]